MTPFTYESRDTLKSFSSFLTVKSMEAMMPGWNNENISHKKENFSHGKKE